MKNHRLARSASQGGALHQKFTASKRSVVNSIGFNFGKALQILAGIALFQAAFAPKSTAAALSNVNLAWNSNPETNITGYKVSYGTASGAYSNVLNVGTTTVASISGLTENTTYYFAVSAINSTGLQSPYSSEISYFVAPTDNPSPLGWTLLYVDSQESAIYKGSYAFDGDPNTYWHTAWTGSTPPPPHEIQIDLGSVQSFNGFRYVPRQDALLVGNVGQFEFYISQDGVNWGNPISTGTFQNTHDAKETRFAQSSARYIRFRGLTDGNGGTYMTVAELELIKDSVPLVNHAPLASAATSTVSEDSSVAIILQGTDSDGDNLTYSLVTSPTNGILTGISPNLTYAPSANYNGKDAFTFLVNDGTVNSVTATVSITVSPVNDAPVIANSSLTTEENQPLPITLTGTDIDGDFLTYTIRSNPTNGTLTGIAPNFTYIPNPGFSGSDQIRFRANDGTSNSKTATISLTVTPVNHAPVAIAKSITTAEDIPLPIMLGATDSDGDNLSFILVSSPSHGSISGSAPNITYTPASNYYGNDQFTFRANDGSLDSAVATISITVTFVNDAPVVANKSVTTQENKSLSVILTGGDADGDTLTFSIDSSPSNGILTGTPPNLTYVPNSGFSGSDQFKFKAFDGLANSTSATVSITVTAVNHAPVAIANSITTAEDNPLAIMLGATDSDGDNLSFILVSSPSHGSISGSTPNITYTPASNYYGNDQFTFRANDGSLDSAVATISITVTSVNDAPVVANKSVTTQENKSLPVVLTGSDADGDTLTFSIDSSPSKGILTGTPPNLTYVPNSGFSGSDQFKFKAFDGIANSTSATVTITVTAVNHAPVAIANSITTAEDNPLAIMLGATDSDGDNLSFILVSSPSHGSISGKAPNLTYTPASNYNGNDQFTFRANDGSLDSAVATISITVTSVNDAPVVANKSVTTQENKSLPVVLTGSDADGDTLTFSIDSSPSKGILTGTPPNLTYVPNSGFSGSDQFKFKAFDGNTNSTSATVSITVTAVNHAPVAIAKSETTAEDNSLNIVLGATDGDGDSLSFVLMAMPTHGTVSGKAPNIIYTPTANFNGTDQLTFKVSDGSLESVPATVSITVTPVNDAPLAESASLVTPQNTSLSLTLGGSDPDGSTPTFTVVGSPTNGTLSGTAPDLTYLPNTGYAGSDEFTFETNDGSSISPLATISITITPITPPTAIRPPAFSSNPFAFQATENLSFSGQINATSLNPADILTYTKISGPTWLTVAANGALNGIPLNENVGTNTFVVRATDKSGGSSDASVNINVENINNAPTFVSNPVLTEDANENAEFTGHTLAGSAVDSDTGDTLTYSKVSGPEWLIVSPAGELSGTPPTGSAGLNTFTVRVSDGSTYSDAGIQINVSGLPLPWATANLGINHIDGSTSYDDGTYAMTGSGGFGGSSDKLHFTYQTLLGNGEITARIVSRQNSGKSSLVGVMIRDTLATNSSQVFLGLNGTNTYRSISRTSTGRRNSEKNCGSDSLPEAWVRLVRRDNVITAYKSKNGVNWTSAGSTTIKMSINCYIGLSICSGNSNTLNSAEFSNVRTLRYSSVSANKKRLSLRLNRKLRR